MTVPISGSVDRFPVTSGQLADLLGAWSAADGPLYRQLAARLATLADAGILPAGTVLPAERELATTIAVSRTTTAAAYQQLREQGLAETRRGSGTRIAAHQSNPTAAYKANSLFAGLLGAADIAIDLTIAAPDCAPSRRRAGRSGRTGARRGAHPIVFGHRLPPARAAGPASCRC
jgi:DNA-binding transcriptional regulator YhcF (GntR family)